MPERAMLRIKNFRKFSKFSRYDKLNKGIIY